jgi:hypothetical protein
MISDRCVSLPRPRKPLLLSLQKGRYPLSVLLAQLPHSIANPDATSWRYLDKSRRGAGCNDAG